MAHNMYAPHTYFDLYLVFPFHEFYQLSLVNQGILEKCNIWKIFTFLMAKNFHIELTFGKLDFNKRMTRNNRNVILN